MASVKINCDFHGHPKIAEAGLEAVGLFVLALSWCGRYLTDGYIPAGMIKRLCLSDNYQEIINRLVDARLLEIQKDGYVIHDYLDYNPSKSEIQSRKRRWREWARMRKWVLERDNWTCCYCGAPAEHVDHITPRSRGGKDEVENLVASCVECNLHKGARTPEEAGMELMQCHNGESYTPRQ